MDTRYMCRRFMLLASLFLAGLAPLPAQPDPPTPESVVVVANGSFPGSKKVARAYMERRGIPKENLVVLKTVSTEQISREAYIETIHNPLLETLLERKLIDASKGGVDEFGRHTVVNFSNPVRYLVLCHGIPTVVTEKPADQLDDLAMRESWFASVNPAFAALFLEGRLAKNEASVDGELALLLRRNVPMTGFIQNPYYQNRDPDAIRDILKVTRLDGPSPESVLRMLDNALEGERKGLKGRAYVDFDTRGGGFQLGNDWLERTERIFEAMGFDMTVDRASTTMGPSARFDAPVLYAGWYSWHVDGPFTLPGFRFPPGAVAAHLHSVSARPMRSADRGWVGPFVDRGVSATFGNVSEPYLRFTHQFDAFFAALAEGWAFADAAYFALPVLSWQATAVGDPLYRPFAVALEEQVQAIGEPSDILADQYVALRQSRLEKQKGGLAKALAVVEAAMHRTPGPALALEQARLLTESEMPNRALEALRPFAGLEPDDSSQWGLMADIADQLAELGDAEAALRIYRKLEKTAQPEPVLLAFLERGIQAAEKAGATETVVIWRTRVSPPEPEASESPGDPGATSPDNP